MARSGYQWAIRKSGPEPLLNRSKTDYPEHKRASRCYCHHLSGYTEPEIASFFGLSVEEVKRDIQHIQSTLATRTILSHNNDRQRILLQRAESEKYRKLLGRALSMTAEDYLRAGIAPAGSLKEYREAVGMTEKPGGISVSVSQQNITRGSWHGIRSSEDLLRSAIKKLEDPQVGENPEENEPHDNDG